MRRRELRTGFIAASILIAGHLAAPALCAQSVIQRPSCKGVIHGVVSDLERKGATGFAVAAWPLGVAVQGLLPSVKTNGVGEYRFEHVCPGRYTVLPDDEAAGYPRCSPEVSEFLYGRSVEEIRLTADKNSAELNLSLLAKPGRMRVHITNRTTNLEIQQFTVEMIVPGRKKAAQMEALFYPDVKNHQIEVPPDCDFVIYVTADGFRKWTGGDADQRVFRVAAGAESILEVRLQPL